MPFRIRVSLAIVLALLGVVVFGPLVLPIPDLENTLPVDRLTDEDSAFVEVGDLTVHYREGGFTGLEPQPDLPALLLLHGFGANTDSWRKVIDDLSLSARTVAFDRPAFGLTERPEHGDWRGESPYSMASQVALTVGLMDSFGIDRAVLVGSSSGGAVAAEVALAHPDRVAGLVLVDAAIFEVGGPPAWTRLLLSTPQLNRLGPRLMRQFQVADETFYQASWSDPDRILEDDLASYRKTFQVERWDRALWELTKVTRPLKVADRLGELELPVLVVTGADDRIVPPEQSEELARQLPNATLAVFDSCGHLPHEECPLGFLAVLEGWLPEALVDNR